MSLFFCGAFRGFTATLCGVSVVEQLGLTVWKDLNLRRIWTLTDPGRHQGIQILETGHPYELQVSERSDGVVRTIAGRARSFCRLKGIPGRVTLGRHWRLVH